VTRAIVWTAFAGALLGGCGGIIPPPAPPTPAAAAPTDAQSTRCTVERDQARPLLVEWPAADKAALEAQSQDRIVVVAYEGCRLRLLPGCGVAGTYEFRATSPARDLVEVRTEDELYTRLPLGAVSLEGELRRGNELRIDYVVVGQRRASLDAVPAGTLSGAECEGATHFVRAVVVGAYELSTRASVSGSGGGAGFGVGAGGGGSGSSRVLRHNGDLAACAEASEETAASVQCQAFVQLDLAAIDGAAAARPGPSPAGGAARRGGGGGVPAPTNVEVHLEVGESAKELSYQASLLTDAGAARCAAPLRFATPCTVEVPRGRARIVVSGESSFSREVEILGGDRFLVEERSHAVGTTGWVLAPVGAAGVVTAIVVGQYDDTEAATFMAGFFGGSLLLAGIVLLIVDWSMEHGYARRPDEDEETGFGFSPM
jgi:hypothetical protein